VALVLALVVIVAGAVTTVLLLDSDPDTTLGGLAGTPASSTPAPPSASTPGGGSATPPKVGEPTGAGYDRDQPTVGECVDTKRSQDGGVLLYRADCAAASTPLVLDRVVPRTERCLPRGYYSVRGFDGSIMCFAWMVQPGDCIILTGPRKADCPPPGNPAQDIATITDVRAGATDGTGCPHPDRWLQAGTGPNRGTACFTPTTVQATAPPTG
jgi:hypothetical protein